MSNQPNMNDKTFVPTGPATGKTVEDQHIIDDTPYTGTKSPDGKANPYHVPGGPGHKDCDPNESTKPEHKS